MPADGDVFLGIDLGGTKVLSVVARRDGTILGEDQRPSRGNESPGAVVDAVVASAAAATEAAGNPALAGAGLASPGPIDMDRGVVTTPPNFADWRDVPLVALLEERLGLSVRIDNDGNLGALGEHVYGAGRGVRHLIYIALGTGFGTGVIADGRIFAGYTRAGAELGHLVLDYDGRACNCGNTGCIEAYVSGVAIAGRAETLAREGYGPAFARELESGPLTAKRVFELAREGEPSARALIHDTGLRFGAALSSLVNAFSPERLVVGGAIAASWDDLVVPAEAEMRRRAFPHLVTPVTLVPAELGTRAAAMGAVALAAGSGG